MKLELDERIDNKNIHGYIKYIGPLKDQHGTWVGILLDEEDGKNDGTYKNIKYFECEGRMRGIFVRAEKAFVRSENDYKDKYERLVLNSKARQVVNEYRNDNKINEFKMMIKGKNEKIEKLKKKIKDMGDGSEKVKLKERIAHVNVDVERLTLQIKDMKDDLVKCYERERKVKTGNKNLYREALMKLFECVNDDEAFLVQYDAFMKM